MKVNKKGHALSLAAGIASIAFLSSGAKAQTVAAWNFENDAIAVNNSPAQSSGSATGTAGSIGMNIYPTTTVGVTTDDVLQGASGDTGTNGVADLTQTWRIRAQNAAGTANGWSSLAPIGTQGATFAASTVGYSNIKVAFDWYATNQGEANLQLEYTTDGTHFTNIPIVNSGGSSDVAILTNSTSSNTVTGTYAQITGGQQWAPDLTATISDPAAANDPNFAIEMVNASMGADCISAKGTALNNDSGNWRFDNVVISGTAVPEPASLSLLALGAMGLAARRRRASR